MNHFFALVVPQDVRQQIAEHSRLSRKLLGPDFPARWYSPDDNHVTLKFLGPVAPERAQDLIPVARRIAEDWELFPIGLAPAGAFPDIYRPSVLWAGVETAEALSRLASTIGHAMERQGFAPESRPYRPHITLARCHAPRSERAIQSPPRHEQTFPFWQAVGLALMQTLPSEQRRNASKARYNIVHLFPFGTPPSSAE